MFILPYIHRVLSFCAGKSANKTLCANNIIKSPTLKQLLLWAKVSLTLFEKNLTATRSWFWHCVLELQSPYCLFFLTISQNVLAMSHCLTWDSTGVCLGTDPHGAALVLCTRIGWSSCCQSGHWSPTSWFKTWLKLLTASRVLVTGQLVSTGLIIAAAKQIQVTGQLVKK